MNIMKGSRGLHTQPDPSRIGPADMSACMNVDIMDNNMVMRRRGMLRKVIADAHSLFPVGERYCLFGSGSGLWKLLPDFAGYAQIAAATPGNVSYALVDQIAYWMNGAQKGKVIDGENQPWVKADTVYSNNQTRNFYDPPIGRYLGYYNGRMYIMAGKVIWYSEPYGPDIYAMGDSYLSIESEGTMLRPVDGGIYISDAAQTWFVSGSNPGEFNWRVVDNFPALPYSDKSAVGAMAMNKAGDMVFLPGGKTEVAFWLTNNGCMYGDGAGNVTCLTEERIDLVSPATAGAILVDGTNLVAQFI